MSSFTMAHSPSAMRSPCAGDGVAQTKVRSLLKPRPMKEFLIEDRFERVKTVVAATGIKVSAPGLDGAIAGSPLKVIGEIPGRSWNKYKEMEEIKVKPPEGLVIKADTIGALEAICNETRDQGDRSDAGRGGSG